MMKTSFHSRRLIAAGLFLGSLFFAAALGDTAMAAPATPPAGGAPAARILMVDLRRVMAESKVGHDMQRQVEALNNQVSGDLKAEKASLQKEQVALQQQSAILAADVKARRIKDFETKVASFQDKVQKRGSMIQGGVMKAQSQIEQALGPVLQGVMRERGATILLDRSSVLLGINGIDMTSVVIQRLDMKMTSVKVELAAPPTQPGAPQGAR
ncbi:MAG: OmpH family outer membrane protein [Rhizomicrobium sp.]